MPLAFCVILAVCSTSSVLGATVLAKHKNVQNVTHTYNGSLAANEMNVLKHQSAFRISKGRHGAARKLSLEMVFDVVAASFVACCLYGWRRNLKLAVCWGTSLFVALVDFQGHGGDAWEESREWSETLCQAGMAVVMVSMVWESIRAAMAGAFSEYVKETFCSDAHGPKVALTGLGASIVTMILITYKIHKEDSTHSSIKMYHEILEMLCHMIISAALVGMLHDFIESTVRGKTGGFVWNFVSCNDNMEEHGIDVENMEVTEATYDRQPADWPKAGCLWFMFLAIVYTNHFVDHEGHDDTVRETFLTAMGVLCAGGIACGCTCVILNGRIVAFTTQSASPANIGSKAPKQKSMN